MLMTGTLCPVVLAEGSEIAGYRIGKPFDAQSRKLGCVYEASCIGTGDKVVCKYLNPANDPGLNECEVQANRELKSPHCLLADAVVEFDDTHLLFLPFCDGVDLLGVLASYFPLPIDWILDISFRILTALDYMHKLGWVHRDVKADNILIKWVSDGPSKRPLAHLADFGLAKKMPGQQRLSDTRGSELYRAPEMWNGQEYGEEVDCWAFGVTLFSMATKTLPFDEGELRAMSNGYFSEEYLEIGKPDGQLVELIRGLLQPDVSRRLTAAAALSLPIFSVARTKEAATALWNDALENDGP
jgi:serine/threonine protein kinase